MRFGALVDFVSDAPENHAGMIAIAEDHAFEIALPPVLEVEVIILRIFVAGLPAIKGFVDDQHAQAIAGIEEIARWRIVASAYGVVAVRLENLDAALICVWFVR